MQRDLAACSYLAGSLESLLTHSVCPVIVMALHQNAETFEGLALTC